MFVTMMLTAELIAMKILCHSIFHMKQWKAFFCGDSGIKHIGDLNVPWQKAQMSQFVLWIDLICLFFISSQCIDLQTFGKNN